MGKIQTLCAIKDLRLVKISPRRTVSWKFWFTLSLLQGPIFAWIRSKAYQMLDRYGDLIILSGDLRYEVNGGDDSASKILSSFEPIQRTWIPPARKGSVFLDIGANIGLYSLHAWRKGYRVFAFEIGEKATRRFKRNCELNRADRVELITVALGAEEQELVFYEQDIHTGGSGFSQPDSTIAVHERKVKMQPLDAQGIDWPSVHYVKIDVEGYELDVLQGASKLLEQSDLGVLIQVEILNDPASVISLLAPFGFSIKKQLNKDYLFQKQRRY